MYRVVCSTMNADCREHHGSSPCHSESDVSDECVDTVEYKRVKYLTAHRLRRDTSPPRGLSQFSKLLSLVDSRGLLSSSLSSPPNAKSHPNTKQDQTNQTTKSEQIPNTVTSVHSGTGPGSITCKVHCRYTRIVQHVHSIHFYSSEQGGGTGRGRIGRQRVKASPRCAVVGGGLAFTRGRRFRGACKGRCGGRRRLRTLRRGGTGRAQRRRQGCTGRAQRR